MTQTKEFKNRFSWSSSRSELFAECKRKYYYQYYGFWGGWKKQADRRLKTLYMLKQLDNRFLWKGNIIHEAIAFLILSRLKKQALPLEQFKETVVKRMRNQYRESLTGQYRSNPKYKFGLLEHEYNEQINDKAWCEIRDSVIRGIDHFTGSTIFSKIKQLDPGACLAIEGDLRKPKNIWGRLSPDLFTYLSLPYTAYADSFKIGEIPIWAKIDFAFQEPSGTVHIIDWKSSVNRTNFDPFQLKVYGLYAQKNWVSKTVPIKLSFYNVSNDRIQQEDFNRDDHTSCLKKIRLDIARMQKLLVNKSDNTGREEDFVKTDNKSSCRYCRYRRVCLSDEDKAV